MISSVRVTDALQREAISLDGPWDFLHVVEDYRARPVHWRKIEVPGPWQAQCRCVWPRSSPGGEVERGQSDKVRR